MSETKTYYKNFVTMLSGNVVSQIIPFVLAPILTRLFHEEDFAIFANYLAIASLIGIVVAGRLELAIPISKNKQDAQNVVFTGLMITLALTVLSIFIPIFSTTFGELYENPELSQYMITIPVAILSIGLLGIANNWILRHKKYSVLTYAKIAQSIFNNGLAALFGYIGWGPSGLIYGWLIGQLSGILVLAYFTDRKVTTKNYNITTIKTTIKENKDFPLINSLHAFTDILASQFLLYWIISTSFGLIELGLFVMMDKYVRAPIVLITSSISSIFYSEMSTTMNEGRSSVPILKKTISTSILFSVPFFIVLFFFAPQLFGWYLGPSWETAGEYARVMIPSLFIYFVLSPISSIPILMNQQRKAFLFILSRYIVVLGSMGIAVWYNWDFIDVLTLYSLTSATFQLLYLYWFYSLIKKQNADIG